MFLRDANQPGHGYLACYDPKSKLPVGYLGRQGFCEFVPRQDEKFEFGFGPTFRYSSNKIASLLNINAGRKGSYNNYQKITDPKRFSYDELFVCDGDTIQYIDLPRRTVRLVAEFKDLVGVEIVTVFPPVSADMPLTDIRPEEQRLLVRTKGKLILFNTFADELLEFPIPDELLDKQISVSVVGMDKLMFHIDRGWWERGIIVELRTIKSDGTVESIETVQLERTTPKNSPSDAVIPAFLAPSLILWLAGMFVIGPIVQLQNLSVPTLAAGIAEAWNTASVGLALVFLASLILAAIAYRWQQKYSRPNTTLWTTFVFLTTLPGFLAYWMMHRREPMGACQHCGANIPLNHDLCAKCATPLSAPKLLGTEIFA